MAAGARRNPRGRPVVLGLPEHMRARLVPADCGYATPCLVWTGTIGSGGYGVIQIARRQHKAPRRTGPPSKPCCDCRLDGMAIRYLSATGVGRACGVSRSAVLHWCNRYPPGSAHPFPAADAVIVDDEAAPADGGELAGVRLWHPERLPEILRWRAGLPGQGAGGGRPRKDSA